MNEPSFFYRVLAEGPYLFLKRKIYLGSRSSFMIVETITQASNYTYSGVVFDRKQNIFNPLYNCKSFKAFLLTIDSQLNCECDNHEKDVDYMINCIETLNNR